MNTHLMVDIETMSTHTSNALIISIGLLTFDLYPGGVEFGKPTLILPNIHQQLAKGRILDPDTHDFWLRQTPEARAHWADPTYGSRDGEVVPIISTIENVPNHLKEVWTTVENALGGNVWALGSVFDIGNIENLVNMQVPWPYNAARDLRSVARPPYVKLRERFGDPLSNGHDPIADCINQCWTLWEYWPFVENKPSVEVLRTGGGFDPAGRAGFDPAGRETAGL